MFEKLMQIINWLTQGPFTTKKLLIILAITVLAGLSVVSYEIQTANFTLDKYAQATAILKDIDALSSSQDTSIAVLADAMVVSIEEILSETEADPSLSEFQHRLALTLIIGLPWLLLSIIGIVEGVRRVPDWQYGLFGCLTLAALLGGIAYTIPTDIHWFYRYILIPLATYSFLVALFYAAGDDDD